MPLAVRQRRPLPKPQPEGDPRFRRVMDQLRTNSNRVKTHPPAKLKATQAAKAAKGPPNETRGLAKSKQVDKVEEAPTGKPAPTSFLAMLRAEIDKAMPKTLGDTENFMKGGQSENLKQGLQGNVGSQTAKAEGDVKSANSAQPNPAGIQATPGGTVSADASPPSPPVNAPEGMPAPKPADEVSLQDSKHDVDAQMKEAEVTPTQCKKANDPRFSGVLDAKEQVGKQADTAPQKFRTAEQAAIVSKGAQARNEAVKGAIAQRNTRAGANSAVLTKQQQQKIKDEQARLRITTAIEGIYEKTKASVEAKLGKLEEEVGTIFDVGVNAALDNMKSFVEDKMTAYKIDRYLLSPFGSLKWIRDQFKGLPSEVNAFYEQGRQTFTRAMDGVIVRVASLVETRLAEAKKIVADGQSEIRVFVAAQPKELQSFAQEAEKNVSSKFDELRNGIEEKKNQLAQQLAQKYKEAFDKANEELKKIQDENKGLVAGFIEKLGEIIKILAEFKDKLMGLLKKGWDTIKMILADPIGFLGNLLSAIKGGIKAFVSNIWTHLKAGFMEWLFGSLASAGIQVPSDFSLPSILKLVLSVLGLTPDRLRAKAVKLLGPTAVGVIEKLLDYAKALISGGPEALWEKVKEDLGMLKQMVIDAIQSWIVETVIKQAVLKLVSMFNPAGAIIQALIAIYNTVMFLIENASKIMAFIEAIINSVSAIAQGSIDGAISWIERSLASMIPLVIGFLARLLGLSGITDKIKGIIQKVQGVVDKAIDKALGKIIAVVKKLFGKGGDKSGDKDGGDVKAAAGKAVHERLTAGVTPSKTDGVLRQVQSELQPRGLKSLTLGPPDAQGEREVLAEASPRSRVAKLVHKKVTVAVSAKIEVTGDPVLTGLTRGPEIQRERSGAERVWPAETFNYAKFHDLQKEALGGTGSAAMLPQVSQPPRTAARKGSQPSGGLIVEPKAGSHILEILSWNTSQPERGHNVSHAEKQFINWFEARPQTWLNRVKSVHVEVDGRPVCPICETDLKALRSRHKSIKTFSWTGAPAAEGEPMEVT